MLTWAAVVAVFLLMSIGNVVSATGSGLACPDWPLCHGRLIPPLRPDVLIEYSHRLVAALASLLIVATIVMAMRRSGQPAIRRMGWTLLALLAAQIGLGGITVLLKLPDLISTAHLVNALLIFGGLLVLAASERGARAAPAAAIARLARAGLGVLLVQLALGGYVRHSGAGLACPDFPLCSGAVLPGHWLAVAHWTHRWLGVLLLGLFIHLGSPAAAPRWRARPRPRRCSPWSRWPSASPRSCSGSTRRSAPPTPPSATRSGATLVWTAARSGAAREPRATRRPRRAATPVAGARLA